MTKYLHVAVRVLLFALFGLLIQVFFTSTDRLRSGNWVMYGHTSPWMMLDYGLLGIAVGPICTYLSRKHIPLLGRAVVYMLGIFLVEYVSGHIFTYFGLHIWDYSNLPLNLQGQITLTFAPLWYFLGLWLEFLYRRIDACAWVMLHGVSVPTLENWLGNHSMPQEAVK